VKLFKNVFSIVYTFRYNRLRFDIIGLEPETHLLPQGEFSRQCFSESPMSGDYFGRLFATGEWGVCLLSSCSTLP